MMNDTEGIGGHIPGDIESDRKGDREGDILGVIEIPSPILTLIRFYGVKASASEIKSQGFYLYPPPFARLTFPPKPKGSNSSKS